MKAPGTLFAGFLDSVYKNRPIRIIETGCMRDLAMTAEFGDGWSTIAIARWVKAHPDCTFDSVDLSINSIELAHSALEAESLSKYCAFHCQDSLLYLSRQTWADFCFLDSCDGLQHGLDEYRIAASIGSQLIIMDDVETKASWAIKESRESGWKVSFEHRYAVLRRP